MINSLVKLNLICDSMINLIVFCLKKQSTQQYINYVESQITLEKKILSRFCSDALILHQFNRHFSNTYTLLLYM